MPALDHPTAMELWEERTWRVVTLCCTSSEPDWRGEGRVVQPGNAVLVRLQGYLDGRCGWDGVPDVQITLDGAPLALSPLFPRRSMRGWTLLSGAPDSLWLATVPAGTSAGEHGLSIRYRDCAWSGAIDVGRPAPVLPPQPALSADYRWVQLPDYGAAVWWFDTPYDATPEHWLHLPPDCRYGPPTVICALDASGHSHGAWEIRDTVDKDYNLLSSVLVPTDYAACDALR